MISNLSAIQTNESASTSLESHTLSSAKISASSSAAESRGDTVQWSNAAQQYLQASQSNSTEIHGMVEQLVRAAAAGDTGALSLLTVI